MSDDGPGQREVAHRLFAAEYDDANHSYAESDEERAPNYVVTPTGARLNRVFVVGVLTEVEQVGDDILRARVADQTGVFVLYAGQYQPDEQAFLERADPPAFVAVTGKARTFQPEDTSQVYTSVRPESINHVDAATRDRFTVRAAEQSLERVKHATRALAVDGSGEEMRAELERAGVAPDQAEGIERALEHYGTATAYLDAIREMALDGARVVTGERDEVRVPSVAPDAAGGPTAETLLGRLGETVSGNRSVTAGDRGESTATAPTGREAATTETGTTAGSTTAEPGGGTTDGAERGVETDPARDEATATTGATRADSGDDASDQGVADSTGDDGEFDTQTATDDSEFESTEDEIGGPEAGEDVGEFDPVEDEIGDFEPSEGEIGDTDADEDVGEFDPEDEVLSDEEREDIEQEYGTDFQSGGDVEPAGTDETETSDLDSEPPAESQQSNVSASTEPDDVSSEPTSTPEAGADDSASAREADVTDSGVSTEHDPADATSPPEPDTGDVDDSTDADDSTGTDDSTDAEDDQATDAPEEPQETVLSLMEELDEGSGAKREAVLEAAVERYGLSTEEAEEAIQDALMDGQCYEPDDSLVKPI